MNHFHLTLDLVSLYWLIWLGRGLVNSLCYLLLCIDYLGSEFVLVISNVKRSCVSHKASLFLYQFYTRITNYTHLELWSGYGMIMLYLTIFWGHCHIVRFKFDKRVLGMYVFRKCVQFDGQSMMSIQQIRASENTTPQSKS